jgi:hypothetical protein
VQLLHGQVGCTCTNVQNMIVQLWKPDWEKPASVALMNGSRSMEQNGTFPTVVSHLQGRGIVACPPNITGSTSPFIGVVEDFYGYSQVLN